MRFGWIALARLVLISLSVFPGFHSRAATVEEGRRLLLSGDYATCISTAQREIRSARNREEWHLLLGEALLATGKYKEALSAATNALADDRWNLRYLWQAREAFQCNGQVPMSSVAVQAILRYARARPEDYADPGSLVVAGKAALLDGMDAKRVLDTFYEFARKLAPKFRDVYLARGQLALEKHDYALAAKAFHEGLKELPDDPDLHFGLAQAYAGSEPALAQAAIESALKVNSNHVGTLLLIVNHSIDAEDFAQATTLLDRAQAINPAHPDAWAYRAVLAHFKGDLETEEAAREQGLKFWPGNPRVDYLIGRKLSQNYRFTEGAEHQRMALAMNPDYLPAKAQLAQDLLRLGDESAGWGLAAEVQKQDAYDVEAYNLGTLEDTLKQFATLTNGSFVLRMSRREAEIYGERVLQLLSRAKNALCAKYGLELMRPVLVEMFPEQKDFAVRTFGMPGNPGYLGVCFGNVITANSPAANPGTPINWEGVLWHEFCHVVTLQLTKNKMPRWLSEGISVHEELQANPAWGQRMNPRYREMILDDDELTPVSKLSGAFLNPRSELHLQFAYYQSALVVDYIVSTFGIDQLKAILAELGKGTEINAAIEKHTRPMSALDQEFKVFAQEKAKALAPGLDFARPAFTSAEQKHEAKDGKRGLRPVFEQTPQQREQAWDAWAKDRPTNFWALQRQVEKLVEGKQWQDLKPVLEKLVQLYPDFTGEDSAYRTLAAAHRALGETNQERQVLSRFAIKDEKAVEAYGRLMELAAADKDWATVSLNAERYLAVNPLVPQPYRYLARAAEGEGKLKVAAGAWRTLLRLDPPDPADANFQVARLLHHVGDKEAKRHLLDALEEAPRHEAALALLLELRRTQTQAPNGEWR
jgi:tetratricopeptide (TPR) repeat protein